MGRDRVAAPVRPDDFEDSLLGARAPSQGSTDMGSAFAVELRNRMKPGHPPCSS
jgi:hypothetical protein